MSSFSHDTAIIGLGINGSSTLYSLAKLGIDCIAFEQNDAYENIASSQGPTRIIRKAYFEGADHYQKFINRGYQLWKQIEKEANVKLYEDTGVLYIDKEKDGVIVNEIIKSHIKYGYECKRISLDELEADQPFFNIKNRTSIAVIEKDSGMLYADKCIKALLDLSLKHKNVTIKDKTSIINISKQDNMYLLYDDKGCVYKVKNLILANGSWALDFFKFFPGLKPYRSNFRVENAMVHYYKIKDEKLNKTLKRPFYIGKDNYHLYGFPDIGDGKYIKSAIYKYYEGDNKDFTNKSFDTKNYEDYLKEGSDYFRYVNKDSIEYITHGRCTFTITTDEHYVIDRIPLEENAYLISACSGHGFKFGPSIGEYVANAMLGKEGKDEFFGFSRFDKLKIKF